MLAAVDYRWSLQPQVLAALAGAAAIYGWRFRELRTAGDGISDWRALALGAGLLALLTALVSPIDTLGETRLFSVHMAQHLLLADVAPILLLLGLTRSLVRPATRRLVGVERSLGPLAHPAVALIAFVSMMWLWHLPAMYELALRHSWAHDLEHASFFGAGIAFWWYIIEPVPPRHRLGGAGSVAYVGAAKLGMGALGVVLAFSTSAIYDTYERAPRSWGLTPVTDLNIGGLEMMLEQSLVLVIFFAIMFVRMLERSERTQQRRERLGATSWTSS